MKMFQKYKRKIQILNFFSKITMHASSKTSEAQNNRVGTCRVN